MKVRYDNKTGRLGKAYPETMQVPDPYIILTTDEIDNIVNQTDKVAFVVDGSVVLKDRAELEAEEKEMFLSEIGVSSGGLDRLIERSYDLLGLMSYLTAGQPEVRAWTIKKGTKAPQAAGKIHTDFERGFIRAEVVSFDVLMECGSMQTAKEKGLVRSEGKEYVMQDGDIVLFRFNV